MGPFVVESQAQGPEHLLISERTKAKCGQYNVCHEHDEMPFIVDPNTLVYPWTVMVVLQYATVTYSTMVCPLRPDLPTFPTFRGSSSSDFYASYTRPPHSSHNPIAWTLFFSPTICHFPLPVADDRRNLEKWCTRSSSA